MRAITIAPSIGPSLVSPLVLLLTRQSKTMHHKFALIPRPLLPEREKGSRIGSPSPALGEGLRVRANAFTTVAGLIVLLSGFVQQLVQFLRREGANQTELKGRIF
jgi:hypothetical protein